MYVLAVLALLAVLVVLAVIAVLVVSTVLAVMAKLFIDGGLHHKICILSSIHAYILLSMYMLVYVCIFSKYIYFLV